MTTARQLRALERRVDRLARAEARILERLMDLSAELERMLRSIDHLTLPPRRRKAAPLPPGVISLQETRQRR